MPKHELDYHHQPRKLNKQKRHGRGFSEDYHENRKNRISFKNYLKKIKEDELLDDQIDNDDEISDINDDDNDDPIHETF